MSALSRLFRKRSVYEDGRAFVYPEPVHDPFEQSIAHPHRCVRLGHETSTAKIRSCLSKGLVQISRLVAKLNPRHGVIDGEGAGHRHAPTKKIVEEGPMG